MVGQINRIFIWVLSLTMLSSKLYSQDIDIADFLHDPTGTTSKFHHNVIDQYGDTTAIPIVVVSGVNKGPVTAITAGIHGYEYPPIIAIQELINEINPNELNGDLVFIPIANPSAFYNRSPFVNPVDQLNLNRSFPGDSTGTITDKIAHFITSEIIAHADIYIDIHGGDANEDLLPFVCYYNNESPQQQTATAAQLCMASGFDYVVSYPYTITPTEPAKYAFKQAVQDGKIALSIECGKLGTSNHNDVQLIKMGVYNMLSKLSMYQVEQSEQHSDPPQILNNQSYIRSDYRGLFKSDLNAGDLVNQGDIVGYIHDSFGETIKVLRAPSTGIILYKIGTPPVNVGETIMCIAYP